MTSCKTRFILLDIELVTIVFRRFLIAHFLLFRLAQHHELCKSVDYSAYGSHHRCSCTVQVWYHRSSTQCCYPDPTLARRRPSRHSHLDSQTPNASLKSTETPPSRSLARSTMLTKPLNNRPLLQIQTLQMKLPRTLRIPTGEGASQSFSFVAADAEIFLDSNFLPREFFAM